MAKGKGKGKGKKKQKLAQPIKSELPSFPLNNFKAFIQMDSDWHIGLGAGIPGNIDSMVQRDADGIPGYIEAKTLTGVWRDACEAVALGLDNYEINQQEGIWSPNR